MTGRCALTFAGVCLFGSAALADGPYPGAAGTKGSTAVVKDDPRIVAWASAVGELHRGYQNIASPSLLATWGEGADALGPADADEDSFPVVSLGDGGWITLTFDKPIMNGAGPDFAVFENGITDTFLELAYVDVSSDGVHYFRFPSVSLTQTSAQIGGFGSLNPTNIHNLAGKYRRGFGTPFDLADLAGVSGLDVNNVRFVRVEDVVGSIIPAYARRDSLGNIINDPWSTPYDTGGFDLDAIAVLNQIPEPGAPLLLACGAVWLAGRARSRRRSSSTIP